jgi:multiple sugar transport system substrate-binding protein
VADEDAANSAAEALNDEIVKSLGYDAAAFPEGLLSAGNYRGSQYGIP